MVIFDEIFSTLDSLLQKKLFHLSLLFVFFIQVAITLSPLYSYGCDQYVYILAGRTIVWQDTLYVDFFDHKGPIFLGFQALGYLINHGFWGIWAILLFFAGLAIYRLYIGLSLYIDPFGACLVCLGILGMHTSFFDTPDLFSLDCVVLSIGQLLQKPRSRWSYFCCGFMGSCAFFSKITTIPFFLALFCYVVIFSKAEKNYTCLWYYIIGGTTTAGIVCGILYALGAFPNFFEANITFNLYYSSICKKIFAATSLQRFIFIIKIVWQRAILCLIALFFILKKHIYISRAIWISWFIWICIECIPIYSNHTPYGYYYLGLYLAMFLAFAGLFKSKAIPMCFATLLLFLAIHEYNHLWNLPKSLLKKEFYHPSVEQARLTARIKNFPEKKLWLFNCTTEFFLWTERKSQSRFYYSGPLYYMLGYNHFSEKTFQNMLTHDFSPKNPPLIISHRNLWENIVYCDVNKTEQYKKYMEQLKSYVTTYYAERPEIYGEYELYLPKFSL